MSSTAKVFLRLVLTTVVLFLLAGSLPAALLYNVPVERTQPNGERLDLLASGDEFFNWLHDADGHLVIRDPLSGYWVYGSVSQGRLVSSGLIVQRGLRPTATAARMLGLAATDRLDEILAGQPRRVLPFGSPSSPSEIKPAPTAGTINNIVIFIRFSGEAEFTDAPSVFNDKFNSTAEGVNSMRNYFAEASYNQLAISTTFYPSSSGPTVLSYQDVHARGYYQSAANNPTLGYADDNERTVREHTLLKNAVESVSSQIPAGLNIDADSDGWVDNICFIISGGANDWNDILWPHMWSLYTYTVTINGKTVSNYNFQLRGAGTTPGPGVGVLCHEMFHSLGSPDLYHYYQFKTLHPVYYWDLMEGTANPPQHMGAYMKFKYGKWIPSIPEITGAGTYSLSPLTSSTGQCYKIASPYSANEYFVLEFRKKGSLFETWTPGEGLLVYRINSTVMGNADGPPDEVYIYRPNGTLTEEGDPDLAAYSSIAGTAIDDGTTNPTCFLSDGGYGGLMLSNVGASSGGAIQFNVSFPAAGKSILKTGSIVEPTSLTISPADVYGQSGGTTPLLRLFNNGTNVAVTAPATSSSGLPFCNWFLDGLPSGTAPTITVDMSAAHKLIAGHGLPLTSVLDAPGRLWSISGDNGWYGQSTLSYYGGSAARSGKVGGGQKAVMETTVAGPGSVSFMWKVSSESWGDWLYFYIDDVYKDRISGDAGWWDDSFTFASGTHKLTWSYVKNGAGDNGSDCGWVDQVQITSSDAATIQLVSPNGGEVWDVGSSHSINWIWTGTVGGVNLEYSTDGGANYTLIAASAPNTGSYAWTVPNAISTNCRVRITQASAGGTPTDTSDASFTIRAGGGMSIILDRTDLSFAAVAAGAATRAQTVRIAKGGTGTLNWTAHRSADWITANPQSGSGSSVAIGVDTAGLAPGYYYGTIGFTDPNATNSPQNISVSLTVYNAPNVQPPFGEFDTPVDGTTAVRGAVPVTGWVLDDIEASKVTIYRDPAPGEGSGLVLIADALFVPGARPDVEAAFPDHPLANRAGWGYMLLTNYLPGQGNGTFRLHAFASDVDGHSVLLGTKTITCANASAVKPFGTIDTPTQGGTAGGSSFLNFGWALTPLPNTIPWDGSTILVYVDSVSVGSPTYNQYRADIAQKFPGLNNSGGAVGFFTLNTTAYDNGVHSIAWSVTDTDGNTDGIGSRYFTIFNAGSGAPIAAAPPSAEVPGLGLEAEAVLRNDRARVAVTTGFGAGARTRMAAPDRTGTIRIGIEELERLVVDFGPATAMAGFVRFGDALRPLPVGSTLDAAAAKFHWAPGPGFLGTFELVFLRRTPAGEARKTTVEVTIRPKGAPEGYDILKK